MKIGLYGGSFNPIHNGHIAVAEAVKDAFGLDCILLMVAKDPPHKQVEGHVSAELRLAMSALALEGKKGICASALEITREGKSYTIDTLRALKKIFTGAQIYCIVGADMLIDLPTWREAPELMRTNAFIAAGRTGVMEDISAQAQALEAQYGARIFLSSFVGPEISSTQIRERVFAAKSLGGFTPQRVENSIYENGLYQPPEICAMQTKLRASIKEERYLHSMRTVCAAIALAARYGEDTKKARLAALLHDCGKFSAEMQNKRAEEYGLALDDMRAVSPSIVHGPLGAEVARREYGVEDAQILSAIYWHTLCKTNMSALEKIIYLADKIEAGRDYEGVDEIRNAAEKSLDEGVLACMEHSLRYLQAAGKTIHPNLFSARDFLIKKRESAQKNKKEEQH